MSEIKISLRQLYDLFGQSANNEDLPKAQRALAAQNMVMVRHMDRIEKKLTAACVTNDKHIAELATALAELKPQPKPPASVTTTTPPAPMPAASDGGAEGPDDDEAEALLAKMQAEDAAEAQAASVTPIRPAQAASSAPPSGDAA